MARNHRLMGVAGHATMWIRPPAGFVYGDRTYLYMYTGLVGHIVINTYGDYEWSARRHC